MTLLETSQIIYNFIASFALVLIALLVSIVILGTLKSIKLIKNLIENVNKESSQLYHKINNFLEGISNLSFISRLFKKGRGKK